MAPKRKGASRGKAVTKAADPRAALIGRWLGVPTSFFNVEIEGARYLARVKAPHKDKKDMVWMKFTQAGYGDEAFAPLSVVRKWLITDDEANDPKVDWHEDAEEESELESDEEEALQGGRSSAAGRRQSRDSNEPRGSIKNGRWQPAQAPRTEHVVDSMEWRKASGAVPSHKPVVFARKLPEGVAEGLQQPLPAKGPIHRELFSRQWDMRCWRLLSKYSKLRIKQLKIGTADAVSSKPNMRKRNDGSKGNARKAPSMDVPFLIRMHVIITGMAICRLPARKYYWKKGMFVGCEGIRVIMGENEFAQGVRCVYDCDYTQLIPRGDLKQPPPVGYDKMAKTRELDNLVMENTLATMCPPPKLSDDEASEPWDGKNSEGVAVAYNKDKPHKWATRVQTFNDLKGARYVWHVLNCPRRESAEHGETHKSTLALTAKVHAKYGEGFSVGQDSLYNSPVTVVDGALQFKWNFYGTVGWNRRGLKTDPEMPAETRGSCVSYYGKVSGVPLTYTLMRDNEVVRFLSSKHGVPTAGNGGYKPRWNKAIRAYEEVYMPPVKMDYDAGKVGTDLFGQYMELLETTFKTYHPWMCHHLWLWHGCFVNTHVWRNRLIDDGEARLADAKKQTLIDDTLQTLEELLKYADQLEREAARGKRKRTADPPSPRKQQVTVSRLGSPTRHPPVTFEKAGACMWCRTVIRTGCGNAACGHVHKGKCWKYAHSNDTKIRMKLKRKRVQPSLPNGEKVEVRRRKGGAPPQWWAV